jgi:spectinomycin phosphotransferase
MLEPPDYPVEKIAACLRQEYKLASVKLSFLPLGADLNTAVYRADAAGDQTYFVKLRSGPFDEMSVILPRFFRDQQIPQIIAPLAANSGRLWSQLDQYRLILYPFIAGRDAYQVELTRDHWAAFGTALRKIHAARLPPSLLARIPQERFRSDERRLVAEFLERVRHERYAEPVARRVAGLLRRQREQIQDLIGRTDRLAAMLQNRALDLIVCHSDIHAGNLHLGGDGALYIVDWDEPIRAPKERDLMYIGGGLLGRWRIPSQEESLFYLSYGSTQIDPIALAYYRYERIIQDIAAYCRQLLLSDDGGEDRRQSYQFLASNFLPGHTIEIAYQSDKTSGL